MKEKRGNQFLIYLGMLALAVFILAPIAWIVMMSFKTKIDVVSVPPKFIFTPTLNNYLALFGLGKVGLVTGTAFLSYFKNSLILAMGSVLLSLILGLPAAYAIARLRFGAKNSLAFTFLTFVLSLRSPLFCRYTSSTRSCTSIIPLSD